VERGLIWVPLLLVFCWLAWAGWNEYQKVETYRLWAEQFDRSKYDIYAVLGQKDNELTWGKPTRKGIIAQETLDLKDVTSIDLAVAGKIVSLDNLPSKGKASIVFSVVDRSEKVVIPFTDIYLAAQWREFLGDLWIKI
jgi:hypothetical protein